MVAAQIRSRQADQQKRSVQSRQEWTVAAGPPFLEAVRFFKEENTIRLD